MNSGITMSAAGCDITHVAEKDENPITVRFIELQIGKTGEDWYLENPVPMHKNHVIW